MTLALLCDNKGPSAVCQQKFRTALTLNYLYGLSSFKDPLLTMILCAPIEKQDKGDLSQKGLTDNTKVTFGATKDHG